MNHIELGQKGEEIAVNHLCTKGFEVLERNYKWKNAEVDIICKKNNLLVVVEVKTRNSIALGEPYLSVTRSKQRQIIKVTNRFIELNDVQEEIQFDVVSIILNQHQTKIEHIENAFYPIA
jgi:putative endonuclease